MLDYCFDMLAFVLCVCGPGNGPKLTCPVVWYLAIGYIAFLLLLVLVFVSYLFLTMLACLCWHVSCMCSAAVYYYDHLCGWSSLFACFALSFFIIYTLFFFVCSACVSLG